MRLSLTNPQPLPQPRRRAPAGWAALASLLLSCAGVPPPGPLARPALLSAFFGLDNQLPGKAFWLCWNAPGQDGMPVIFSRRVVGSIDPAAFAVRLRSGAVRHPVCATRQPARDASEGHTVLLIGDLGDAAADPPVQITVEGALLLEGGAAAAGLRAPVTPLEAGPELVMAWSFPAGVLKSDCPGRARTIVQVVWAGGVTAASEEAHRQAYRIELADRTTVIPFALGDLGDNDNYVHLCLDTDRTPRAVCAAAGQLADPRGDLNPRTCLTIPTPKTP